MCMEGDGEEGDEDLRGGEEVGQQDPQDEQGVPQEIMDSLKEAIEAVEGHAAWKHLRLATQRARGMYPRKIAMVANQVTRVWGRVEESLDACEQLSEAVKRGREMVQDKNWGSMGRGEMRAHANCMPIECIEWQRAHSRGDYEEACERNRLETERGKAGGQPGPTAGARSLEVGQEASWG